MGDAWQTSKLASICWQPRQTEECPGGRLILVMAQLDYLAIHAWSGSHEERGLCLGLFLNSANKHGGSQLSCVCHYWDCDISLHNIMTHTGSL